MIYDVNNNKKTLATAVELQSESWVSCMKEINEIARSSDLEEYLTYSRIWEYPWIWFHLKTLEQQGLQVLDIGTQTSPFPWFLATRGFDVIVSDIGPDFWRVWQRANRKLNVSVNKSILNAQILDFPTACVDIYLSVSVIEHVPNKSKVIAEAARVLRPGGILVMTFDICEPDMDMTFPEWNGRALTMREFDDLFRASPWFEPEVSNLPWNKEDIQKYLSWHRTTASHHNYVTGAAVVRRNDEIWVEPAWKDYLRILNGKNRIVLSVVIWYLQHSYKAIQKKVALPIISMIKKMVRRLTMPPLESLLNAPDIFKVYRSFYQHPDLERKPGGWLYNSKFYPDYLTVGGASHVIFHQALNFCQGQGIDVGAGLWPLTGAIPVDIWRGSGMKRTVSDFKDNSLDYVFSSHCLEHIENWQEALGEWIKKLKTGGILFLYLPHHDCAIWHPGSPFVGDGHKWIPTPEIIKQTMQELGCELIQFDDGPDAMQSFYACGRKQGESNP